MNEPQKSSASAPADNPYAASRTAVGDDVVSSWRHFKALANGLMTGTMTAVLGTGMLWLVADFLLKTYRLVDPSKPLLEQLSPAVLAGLAAGLMLVLLVAAKVGSHSRNRVEKAYRKIAAVERKRDLLGEQAADLKRALDERRQ